MGPGDTATQSEQGLALGLSTFAFTNCFAVWTIFAIIGIEIKAELGLNDTQFGLLIGTPILTGSLVRLMLGIWTDQFGGRIIFPLTMLASAASTFLLSYADNYYLMLLAALGLGLAGGGFAVGVAATPHRVLSCTTALASCCAKCSTATSGRGASLDLRGLAARRFRQGGSHRI